MVKNSQLIITEEAETASWEATVSSWVDGEGEVRADELDTPYGRQIWDTYHLIGDVLRSEELALSPSDKFYARLSKAIDEEPIVFAPQNKRMKRSVSVGLSSLAAAAAVAAVAWVATPTTGILSDTPSEPVLAIAADDVWWDYLDAHRDMSGLGPVRQVSYDQGALQ